ncbi:MAG: hypothetical protein AAGB11_16765 [Pseudomonadota bacterium]
MSRTALARLKTHFDACAERGTPRKVWWRDDDATRPGPKLESLVRNARNAGATVAVAAIPADAEPRLLRYCEAEGLAVLQHGVAHKNHQTEGKSAELGNAQPIATILDGLLAARDRLACDVFLPVLVPPWNRMRPDLGPALLAAGYVGVSLFGTDTSDTDLKRVDTHIDPVAWRSDRSLLSDDRLTAMVEAAAGIDGPIGFLTHHKVHDEAIDDFIVAFASLVADHPGAEWVEPKALFCP